jgi:signal transduction histidine kinase
MGLSIIKKLLDYQGGSIVVESDGENGTCFKFKWPKKA